MMGLPYGEEIMIVGRTMWTQSTSVTDGRTDRQTDRRTDRITITKTVLRIASHGKKSLSMPVVAMHIQVSEAMFGALTASQLDYVMKQRGEVEIKVICKWK